MFINFKKKNYVIMLINGNFTYKIRYNKFSH